MHLNSMFTVSSPDRCNLPWFGLVRSDAGGSGAFDHICKSQLGQTSPGGTARGTARAVQVIRYHCVRHQHSSVSVDDISRESTKQKLPKPKTQGLKKRNPGKKINPTCFINETSDLRNGVYQKVHQKSSLNVWSCCFIGEVLWMV